MNCWRFLFILFAVFVLVLFKGCAALKKRPSEPQAISEVNLSQSVEASIELSGFEQGEWPAYNWWVMFEDDQLNDLMEIAIGDNPDLKAAVSRVRSARAEAKKSRSALLPHLDFDFEDDYQHLSKDSLDRFPPSQVPAVINQVNLGLSFEYEIDLFGRNRDKYRAALGEAKAQKAEMSQSLLIITASFAEAYFNFQANLKRVELSQEVVAKRRAYVELVKERVYYGLDDRITLEQAEAKLLQEEEKLTALENAAELNKNELKALMGLSPDSPVEFKTPEAHFNRTFPLPENIPVNLLARRPDLMAQIWKVEAMAHLIGAAKAAFFPNINLGAFLGLESLTWGKLFSSDSYAAALTPALNLPIFKGGKLKAQLEESQANFDAAVYDYNALVLRAAKEVANGLKTLQSVNRQGKLQAETLIKITHSTDLTYAKYENGLDDYLTVIQSQLELLNEGIEEVNIQNNRHLAVLNLIRALGGGYQEQGDVSERAS